MCVVVVLAARGGALLVWGRRELERFALELVVRETGCCVCERVESSLFRLARPDREQWCFRVYVLGVPHVLVSCGLCSRVEEGVLWGACVSRAVFRLGGV